MAERRNRRHALDELLVRRSTERLAPAAEDALARLLAEFPDTDGDAYERAAAAVWLAAAGRGSEPMPTEISQRILARVRPERSTD